MTPEQIEIYQKAAEAGSIPDNLNPLFLLQSVHPDLLVRIINQDFSMTELARHELKSRGLNDEGKWIGFNQKTAIKKRKGPNRRYGKRL